MVLIITVVSAATPGILGGISWRSACPRFSPRACSCWPCGRFAKLWRFLLGCEKVSLDFPTKAVFEGVSLGVEEGARIGVVGRNGDGKSTLLRLMAGLVEPDEGRVIRTRGVSVGVLGQSDDLDDDATVERAVVGDEPEYSWAGDVRTREIIAGLLGDIDWAGRVGDLSGGQRRRGISRAFCAAIGTFSCSTSPRTTLTCAPSPGLRVI